MRKHVILLALSVAAALLLPAGAGHKAEDHSTETSCFSIINPLNGNQDCQTTITTFTTDPTGAPSHLWIEVNYATFGHLGYLLEFIDADTNTVTTSYTQAQFETLEAAQDMDEGGINIDLATLPLDTYVVRFTVYAEAGEFEFITSYNYGNQYHSSYPPPCEASTTYLAPWGPEQLHECEYDDPWEV